MSEDVSVYFDSTSDAGGASLTDPVPRAADRLAHQLALAIVDARLPEGTMLPPEHVLLAKLGCSRVALRGALRLLVGWGLISMRMGRDGGPMVRRPRGADLRDGLAVLVQSERATLADILLARRAIDPILAAEAARHATDELIARMRARLEEMQSSAAHAVEFQHAHDDLNDVFAEAASLVILGVFMRALSAVGELALLGRMPLDEDRCRQMTEAHGLVVDAIAARDPDAAEDAMRACRVDAERYWRQQAPELVGAPLQPLGALVSKPLDLSGLAPAERHIRL